MPVRFHPANRADCRRGYIALLSVLIVAAIAASTVLVIFITSLNSSLNSADIAQGKIAKALADACAEMALNRLSSGLENPCSNCTGDYTLSTTPLQKCTIVSFSGLDGASPNGWTIRVQASNTQNTITRYLEVKATRPAPGSPATINSWRECLNFSASPCPTP